MKIFITGAAGQLGMALRAKYPEALAADTTQLDITNRQKLMSYDWSDFDCLINAAGYTNVDGAESAEGRVAAWRVNATAVGYLAEVARQHDMTLVHISTDYVFDGTKNPHKEDEPFSPLSSYGASKAAGDIAVLGLPKYYLLRTSWVMGQGKNFVQTMLDIGRKGVDPTVVSDQIGRPTFAAELVRAIDHLLSNKAEYGTYNVSNGGEPVNWAELTREIYKMAGLPRKVSDTSTAEYFTNKESVARRPLNSSFDLAKIKATGFKPKDWREDLREYINKELEK